MPSINARWLSSADKTAEQDKEDAVADAAAARAEARESSSAAEAARERARAALDELARKELQRTTEQRETLAELAQPASHQLDAGAR